MINENKNHILFSKLREFALPVGKYAIFGSGPLGIRSLKECHDLDVIVTEDIFEKYKTSPDWKLKDCNDSQYLENDGIEFWKNWNPGNWDINKLIQEAEVIDDLPFVKLEEVLKWKKINTREKDLKDIEIIENYLKEFIKI